MKEKLLEFYVNKINFIKNSDGLDLSFIPPILRRRLSLMDKAALCVINSTYTDDVQNIVFASQYGEFERLLKLINQYTEGNEVSPNTFSGSVHNYPVGFFCLNKQISIPYTAIAAGDNTICAGLAASVVSDYDNVLFCYADNQNAFAINMSKSPKFGSVKYEIPIKKYDFEDFSERFGK